MTNLRRTADHHTLYPRSTYHLLRAGSSRPFFNRLNNLSRPPRPLRPGPTNPRCILDQHNALPDQGPLIADLSIFPERERAGVDRVSGVNGPLDYIFNTNHIQYQYTKMFNKVYGVAFQHPTVFFFFEEMENY